MMRIRWGIWCGSLGALAMAFMACSSSDDPAGEGTTEDAGADATASDAGSGSDGEPAFDANGAKPPFDPADEPVTCSVTPCAVELVGGQNHFCARFDDGAVRCWGDGSVGATGAPAVDDASDAGAPATFTVTGLSDATQISAGGTTSCAVKKDGSAVCWGGNDLGQLGLETSPAQSDQDPHPTPAPVKITGAVQRIDVGQAGVCAVTAAGALVCWGDNSQAQLGLSVDEHPIGGPTALSAGGTTFVQAIAGSHTVLGKTATGELFTWGGVAGIEGTLAARAASVSPDSLPVSTGVTGVSKYAVTSTTRYQPGGGFPRPPAIGIAHACAVSGGQVYCWGASRRGALGTGLPDSSSRPTPSNVPSAKAWAQQVVANGELSCVRLTDGTVQCAGDNTAGSLGIGIAPGIDDDNDGIDDVPNAPSFSMFFAPASAFDGHAVQVAASEKAVCVLEKTGSITCWGGNAHGELGQGTTDDLPHPKPVALHF